MKDSYVQFPILSVKVLCALIKFLILFQNVKQSNASQLLNDLVNNELYLGSEQMYKNTTIRDCVWHDVNDACAPDDFSIILYSGNRRRVYNPTDKNWLRNSAYNRRKRNVILIHGYASGDQDLPLTVLRKAYERHGGYNLFLVNYAKLVRPPCYVSAVSNLRYISRCVGDSINQLRSNGLRVDGLTCVGHSLGAITCGQLRNHLKFRLHKIIALDPAFPLIFGSLRLKKSSARHVHVLQTNAGHFGSMGSIGHVNVCVNSGYIQPYCFGTRHPHLCSHIWSLCYMAQSLFQEAPLIATKCMTYCPNFGIFKFLIGQSSEEINVINKVPLTASGTYCLDNVNPPFCPKFLNNGVGDDMCCHFM